MPADTIGLLPQPDPESALKNKPAQTKIADFFHDSVRSVKTRFVLAAVSFTKKRHILCVVEPGRSRHELGRQPICALKRTSRRNCFVSPANAGANSNQPSSKSSRSRIAERSTIFEKQPVIC